MMLTNKYRQMAAFVQFIFLVFGVFGNIFPEQKAKLTRNDVVLKHDKPSIYLCVDKNLWEERRTEHNDLWLRIYNNTIWAIRFAAEKAGTPSVAMKLSNGNMVAALSDSSIAFPHYQFEVKTNGRRLDDSWGDTSTSNWLPTNTYAKFKVPIEYFKESGLFLEYKYEWEAIGTIGQESYSPIHRVYLVTNDDLDELSMPFCE